MSERQSRASARFCPDCGEPAATAANFCTACGARLRGGTAALASAPDAKPASQLPGLVVLATFLVVGLGIWVFVLRPADGGRLPLAPKAGPSQPAGETAENRLPSDHPPIEIPAEVKTFIAELEQKAAAAPRDLEVWKNLAQVQYRAAQVDRQYLPKAESSFRHVLEIEPKDGDALRGLGNVHFDRDEYAAAIGFYAEYLKLQPDDSNVRTDLGTMYLYSGQNEAAIREYEKVIAADPKFYQAYFNLAIAYVRQGAPKQAAEAFEKAKSLAPDDQTRSQIQAMLDRTAGSGAPAAGGDGFQARIERSLRSHPIAGPKVTGFEWPSPTEGRVLLHEFPMEAMPEFARAKFLERVKTDLEEARRASGAEGAAKLDLVDRDSGKIMATVAAE